MYTISSLFELMAQTQFIGRFGTKINCNNIFLLMQQFAACPILRNRGIST